MKATFMQPCGASQREKTMVGQELFHNALPVKVETASQWPEGPALTGKALPKEWSGGANGGKSPLVLHLDKIHVWSLPASEKEMS